MLSPSNPDRTCNERFKEADSAGKRECKRPRKNMPTALAVNEAEAGPNKRPRSQTTMAHYMPSAAVVT
jgi:hypothetical protein